MASSSGQPATEQFPASPKPVRPRTGLLSAQHSCAPMSRTFSRLPRDSSPQRSLGSALAGGGAVRSEAARHLEMAPTNRLQQENSKIDACARQLERSRELNTTPSPSGARHGHAFGRVPSEASPSVDRLQKAFEEQVSSIDKMVRERRQSKRHSSLSGSPAEPRGSASSLSPRSGSGGPDSPSGALGEDDDAEAIGRRSRGDVVVAEKKGNRSAAGGEGKQLTLTMDATTRASYLKLAKKQVPTRHVNFAGGMGTEKVELIDIPRLRARCTGLGRGNSVGKLLEEQRQKERNDRWVATARASLEGRLAKARAAGVTMPSQLGYEDRLEQVYQRKVASDVDTMLQRLSRVRSGPIDISRVCW
eukprot:TRINITY_DN5137_c0_g1_i1.p1 TRINITY_DN5137_c0_g1~~TRINITY_DN5137_c0_g1_i1.p1  ORF type:complete len:416 (+),score=69.36 TRINITY_DN5137_c0_g1_i1:168-1250(+)